VRAALHEDVDAEAREARRAEREVGRAELLKVLAGRLVVADDDLGDAGGVRGQELFESGNLGTGCNSPISSTCGGRPGEKIRSLTLSETASMR
jgi:hypothetical protein